MTAPGSAGFPYRKFHAGHVLTSDFHQPLTVAECGFDFVENGLKAGGQNVVRDVAKPQPYGRTAIAIQQGAGEIRVFGHDMARWVVA